MTPRRFQLPTLLLASALTGAADPPAPKLEDLSHYGDPSAFMKAAKPLAERGDAEALYLLGKAYHLGDGVKVDLDRATEYYQKAAAKDHARALNNLGIIELDKGRDTKTARGYLERALALGLKLPTLVNLGKSYDDWNAPSEDLIKAGHYYRQAHEAGEKASALDDAIKALVKAVWLESGYFSKEKPSEQYLALRDEVLSLGAQAVMLKRPRGIQKIGSLYFEMKDYTAALPWIRQAADLNEPTAIYTLGEMYKEGLGVAKNHKVSLEFFERAAILDQSDAKYEVGRHWEEAVADMHDAAGLDWIIEHLQAVQKKAHEGGRFLAVAIERAQARAAVSREVEHNARKAKPLPPGPVVLSLKILDISADQGGIPLCNESWYVFAASPENPPDDPLEKERILVEGQLDSNGCTHLDQAGAARLRAELEKGHTLIFCWALKRRILDIEPGSKGEILLSTGKEVHYP